MRGCLRDLTIRIKKREEPLFHVKELFLGSPGGKGLFTCIVGPTGCGKSSLLKVVGGFTSRLIVDGEVRTEKLSLGFLPQVPVIFPQLSAFENATYLSHLKAWREQRDCVIAEVNRLGSVLNLDWNKLNRTPAEKWSGGERQRIALVRALSGKCDLMLLDEPCAGLDVHTRRKLLDLLRRELVRAGTHALYVTHHGDEVLWAADEVLTFCRDSGCGTTFNVFRQSLSEAIRDPLSPEAALSVGMPINDLQGSIADSTHDSHAISRIELTLKCGATLVDFDDGARVIVSTTPSQPSQKLS